MKVKSSAECSILQYFWPALSDNWSWKTILGLFESGSFTEVLLYMKCVQPHEMNMIKNLCKAFIFCKLPGIISWPDYWVSRVNEKNETLRDHARLDESELLK